METLKSLLKESKIKQADVATTLGVHQTLVSQWCTGKSKPNISCIKGLSKILNKPIDEIIDVLDKKNCAFGKGGKNGNERNHD